MTVLVTKKLKKKVLEEVFEKVKKKPKLFDAKKYFGKMKIPGDPLAIQRALRVE